jgi:putative colanic acid biosynthesis UDP-glucose lipid carrier transferase
MTNQGTIRSHQGSFSLGYRLIDILIIAAGLSLAASAHAVPFSYLYISTMLVGALGFILVAESAGVYSSWRASTASRMVFQTAAAWLVICTALVVFIFFAKVGEEFSRLVIGSWMLSSLILLCIWRLIFRQILNAMRVRGYNSRRAAIVGLNGSAVRMRNELTKHPELGIRFDGFFDQRSAERIFKDLAEEGLSNEALKGTVSELIELTKNNEYDLVFIALPLRAQKRIADILEMFGDTTASVLLIPDFLTYNILHARMGSVGNVQTLSIYETPILGFNDITKRLFDVVFSSLVLLLIAIPMLLIAAAVKFTSPGPAIFKQKRYGLDGKEILVWKFRSMSTQDNGDKVVQATKGDARITKVGAFIRKTSLDELPQFINVLQGQMSVVGPRPHAVAHNEEYRKLISYYMLRHKVKPGITGWAQINGYRGETDTLDKMEGRVDFDLNYIRNWSIWLDIKIVVLTVFKGFIGRHVH